jgi:predicted  nucleic acid-binding Zn-ribbon protein
MKKYIHWTVSRLLELHALEGRATASQKGHSVSGNGKESINTLRAKIPLSFLLEHDRQRHQGKRSVAGVRHGVCSGCHSGVSAHTLKALRAGILRGCDNCGRYLYVVEEANEPSPAPKSAKVTRRVRKRSTATRGAK